MQTHVNSLKGGPMLYIVDTVTEGKEMGEEEDTG